MFRTLSFIANHPLTRDRRLAGFARFAKWQIQSRLHREVEVNWIEGAKLVASNGMTGATGNIYCGLHEFADMAFLLHLLRPDDLFVDVGANIGSYTVLASAVVGAQSIAAEPDPQTMLALRRNIMVNGIAARARTIEAAIGREAGRTRFTVGLDTMNHVASDSDPQTREVPVQTLDEVLKGLSPTLIKLDVERFEADVLAGARETLQKSSLLAVETEADSEPVVQALVSAGFERMYYEPLSRSLHTGSREGHSNALFIRDRCSVNDCLRSAPLRTVLGKQI